jgi:hypothetical protein
VKRQQTAQEDDSREICLMSDGEFEKELAFESKKKGHVTVPPLSQKFGVSIQTLIAGRPPG